MARPGQWYLDRSAGKLVYWPLPQEDMSKAEVFAPTLESIIKVRGGSDITIRRLTLTITTTPLIAGGFGAGTFDGAVSIPSGQNCRLCELEILNVGGQGIKASGTRIRIEKCHVHNIGACGIKCSGTQVAVTDNHIHDIGLTYPSAPALEGGGRDSLYSHNEIHDAPYTAINCGGQNNRIENNGSSGKWIGAFSVSDHREKSFGAPEAQISPQTAQIPKGRFFSPSHSKGLICRFTDSLSG